MVLQESNVIERVMRDLKESWNIEVSREMIAQQVQNMDRKLQIMRDIRDIQKKSQVQRYGVNATVLKKKQRELKNQLIDLSIEDNKIVLDRLSKL
ncbi:MAG: hypothetical protein AB7U98_14395 [Candidatus Nitrosocosmicus sp.]|jgi:hypothetical protein